MSKAVSFKSVYGPVQSWWYGRALSIDPIGSASSCSFDCVYCQLGDIERKTLDRQIFIPTCHILEDLQFFVPWDVDVITVSGSGEPTLALNLGEILRAIKSLTNKPIVVLTNGTLLSDPEVRQELALADQVTVKIDAVSQHQLRCINRPLPGVELVDFWAGLEEFHQCYTGQLAVQSMMLTVWDEQEQADYITLMQELQPDEIQLNTPTQPRPLSHHLDTHGNHVLAASAYPVRRLKPVSPERLRAFGDQIQQITKIPVQCRSGNTPSCQLF